MGRYFECSLISVCLPFYLPWRGLVKVKSRNGRVEGCLMGGHHLILGEMRDFLTGDTIVDTHDERYRQQVARLLVEQKGFQRQDLHPRVSVEIATGGKEARVRLDLAVRLDGKIGMLIKYGPGSLTTRHQVALAFSRLLAAYQVPYSVVTNGKDADILENASGDVLARGLKGVFSRNTLRRCLQTHNLIPVSTHQRDLAARILYAYEVDGRCPCDDSVCEWELGKSGS
jgi:hypothetical protein